MPDNKNALPQGTILNTRYKIEGLVGGGGFGLVYRARHLSLNSIVAIKELFPRDIVVRQDKAVHPISEAEVALYQKVLNSFRKEGQRLARLENCPSIARCHDYFEENGTGYLVMEYVEGKSLRELVRTYRKAGKSFSEDALLSLLKKLLAGLKEVHKAGIQHMDIKPENIYLRKTEDSGELSSPVLLDFGAARSQTGHSTGSSLLVGTVPYAPLEQMYEGGAIGPWTDIYALGITLYELIFEETNIPGSTERLAEFHSKGVDPLKAAKSKGKSGYGEKFLGLIDKSIEIKAEDRPQSVEELEQKLSLKIEEIEHLPKSWGKEYLIRVLRNLFATGHLPKSWDKEYLIRVLRNLSAIGLFPKSGYKEETSRQIGDTFRDCATCPEMVVVPAGSFMMGSPADERYRDGREGPQHRVTISKPFAVGKYEVTVGQFEEFVNETGHPKNEWRKPGFKQSTNHPVVNVSWEDAKAYTEWLSTKTGQNYRLLSEAEWEYVTRAGTTTPYHFGTTISRSQANYDDAHGGTVEAGSYPANAFGLHDMHGNVWEWVEDCWHEDYNSAPSDGRAWTINCDKDRRVLRGGYWDSLPSTLRSAGRVGFNARVRDDGLGFRIARTLTSKVSGTVSEEIEHPLKSGDKEETPKRVGDSFRDCVTCPEMVTVPSGSFMMGSPASERHRRSNEGQQHRVTISKPFAVGKYEVTVGQFEEFVNETYWRKYWGSNKWRKPGFNQSANHPVVNVSWKDAKAYTEWLSKKTGQNYRLLSEAEWEYVARAGTTTPYHFGATISRGQANYVDAGIVGTAEVGSYPANAFGLHDVHGNVWEWVEDCWHDNHNSAPLDNHAWTINCNEKLRVLRGGSWRTYPGFLRSASRGESDAWGRDNGNGFRIARDLTSKVSGTGSEEIEPPLKSGDKEEIPKQVGDERGKGIDLYPKSIVENYHYYYGKDATQLDLESFKAAVLQRGSKQIIDEMSQRLYSGIYEKKGMTREEFDERSGYNEWKEAMRKPDTDKVSDTRSEEIEHSSKSENIEEDPKQVGDTFRNCATCPEMMVVPSGSFMMGSPASERGRESNEGPQHRVTISKPFAVGKYEVTRGQYEEFANETRHRNNEWRNPGFKQSANHPVVNVSWEDAKAYTEWLSKKTGQNYRLLNEVEWEYVVRAGTTTAYHFGATISPTQANYGDHNNGTVVVGSYPANAFGLHDMHGNVLEWVEDCWHDGYNGAPSDGSAWNINCYDEDRRVSRGGSWGSFPRNLRSAARFRLGARNRSYYNGFRIARPLTP